MTTDKTPATLAVDVLAVMNGAVEVLLDERLGTTARSLDDARAAVAELIEVAQQVNALSIQSDAHKRLRDALARVKGESA